MFAQMLWIIKPKQSFNADYDDGNIPFTESNQETMIQDEAEVKI